MTLTPDHRYATRPGIKRIGYLNDVQLAAEYKATDILVLPSLVESGTQPPVEAMSLGTLVLIADRLYAHDICENAALFFDPLSFQDFAEKALQLLQDQALRQTLIRRCYELIEKRRTEKPYHEIIDICVDVALKARGKSRLE